MTRRAAPPYAQLCRRGGGGRGAPWRTASPAGGASPVPLTRRHRGVPGEGAAGPEGEPVPRARRCRSRSPVPLPGLPRGGRRPGRGGVPVLPPSRRPPSAGSAAPFSSRPACSRGCAGGARLPRGGGGSTFRLWPGGPCRGCWHPGAAPGDGAGKEAPSVAGSVHPVARCQLPRECVAHGPGSLPARARPAQGQRCRIPLAPRRAGACGVPRPAAVPEAAAGRGARGQLPGLRTGGPSPAPAGRRRSGAAQNDGNMGGGGGQHISQDCFLLAHSRPYLLSDSF